MAHKKIYNVVRQDWEESERGWGQSPDGYSLHLNMTDAKTYVEAYWKTQPKGPAPDYYVRPQGSPYVFPVNRKTYVEIQASKGGIRRDDGLKPYDPNGVLS